MELAGTSRPLKRFLENRPLIRATGPAFSAQVEEVTGTPIPKPSKGTFKNATMTRIELPRLPEEVKRAKTSLYSSASSSIGTICGVAETTGKSEWYRIDFPEPFVSKPAVTLQAELAQGSFQTAPMAGPSFGIPAWGPINWANELGELTYHMFYDLFWGEYGLNEAQKALFTWTFPPGAAEIRGTNEKILHRVWDFMKEGFWLMGGQIGAKIDSVLNEHTPARFDQYNDRVQNAIRQLAALSQRALNDSQRLLWKTIGLPESVMMSPLAIRNVTISGFEFLGLEGQRLRVHWMAVGPVRKEEERRRFRIFREGTDISPARG